MGVTDQNIPAGPDARFAWQPINFYVPAVAISQTDELIYKHVPGFAFEVVDFQIHVSDQIDTASLMLKKGTTDVLSAALTPVDADQVNGALVLTLARFGTETDELNVHVTTDGSGEITDINGTIWVRRRAHAA